MDDPSVPSTTKSLSTDEIDVVVHKQNKDLHPKRSEEDLVMGFYRVGKWSITARIVPLIMHI